VGSRLRGPGQPFFSLIMPAYNRAPTIGRTLRSCLTQDCDDFEIIVADDASTDNTVVIVQQFGDARIKIVAHETNRGPCPARNSAIALARGTWCVMVDSDFELLPGTLRALAARAHRADRDVGNLASGARWDNGSISPFPPSPARQYGYAEYLEWVASLAISEKLDCVRRSVFHETRFPDSRAWEMEFHLGLAARWVVDFDPTARMLVHRDAPNRLTSATGPAAVSRVLSDASDKLASLEKVIDEHGPTMQRAAPAYYRYVRKLIASEATLAGRRGLAARHALSLIRDQPANLHSWSLLAAAYLPRRAFARAIVWRRARQA
jgi:hypothetical protein